MDQAQLIFWVYLLMLILLILAFPVLIITMTLGVIKKIFVRMFK